MTNWREAWEGTRIAVSGIFRVRKRCIVEGQKYAWSICHPISRRLLWCQQICHNCTSTRMRNRENARQSSRTRFAPPRLRTPRAIPSIDLVSRHLTKIPRDATSDCSRYTVSKYGVDLSRLKQTLFRITGIAGSAIFSESGLMNCRLINRNSVCTE